jgi:integrase/recombinase XerD
MGEARGLVLQQEQIMISSTPNPAVSPLRQRMLDDMRMRKLAGKTQAAYVRAVRHLTTFLGRAPDTASSEDLRRFQLALVDHCTSPITINATLTGLKFFFEITLEQPTLLAKMQPVHVPRTLPVVLSRDEVARLIRPRPTSRCRPRCPSPTAPACAPAKSSR